MFVNELAGCWDGREYQQSNIIYRIVKDSGTYLTYRMLVIVKDGERKTFIRNTKLKKPLGEYLQKAGYVRIK
jgi:hypothetical protein